MQARALVSRRLSERDGKRVSTSGKRRWLLVQRVHTHFSVRGEGGRVRVAGDRAGGSSRSEGCRSLNFIQLALSQQPLSNHQQPRQQQQLVTLPLSPYLASKLFAQNGRRRPQHVRLVFLRTPGSRTAPTDPLEMVLLPPPPTGRSRGTRSCWSTRNGSGKPKRPRSVSFALFFFFFHLAHSLATILTRQSTDFSPICLTLL